MAYAADTLRDTIFTNWALTGTLAKLGSEADGDRAVIHLAHTQIKGVQDNKAVMVRKISPQENSIFHPTYSEITDIFEISCKYTLPGTDLGIWDTAESDIEDMQEEVTRIIKTVYDPFTGTGTFFKSSWIWRNTDKLDAQQSPILERVLTLTLIDIRPRNDEVFTGFTGVLALDVSESEGSGLPGSDYEYTEVFDVQSSQGFNLKQVQVTSHPDGVGLPVNFSGAFDGSWIATMFLKASDIGTGAHQINKIWQRISSSEQPEMTFLRTYTAENATTTVVISTKVIITSHGTVEPDEGLLRIQLIGKPIAPSVFTVT